MKKMKKVFLIAILFVLVVACSSNKENGKNEEPDTDDRVADDETHQDTETEDEIEYPDEEEFDDEEINDSELQDDESDTEEETIECEDVVEGMNRGLIAGTGNNELPRDFIIRFPENIGSRDKWPVVFLFHGYGDSAVNFENFLKSEVNNIDMPFILITPVARDDLFTFGIPPKGLDWDMIDIEDGSAEVDLFDVLLQCVDSRWGVDEERVYLSGFSAGAITANSIALFRPEKIASVFTYSGAHFSNPDAREALGEISGIKVSDFFSWPDFEENHNKYTQVLVSGAEGKDTWATGGFAIDFNQMADLDSQYLASLGHSVILCDHGGGHSMSGLSKKDVVRFFLDHPAQVETSPYKSGLPEGWEDICQFVEKIQE